MKNLGFVAVVLTPTIALALVLFLLVVRPWEDRVPLLTGVDGCWAGGEGGEAGRLLVDPDHGTSFNGRPVMWPVGFYGRRAGREVEVVDGATVVATTGEEYYISVAPVLADEGAGTMDRLDAYPAAANCGYAWDLVDCDDTAGDPSGASERECRALHPRETAP